MREELESLRKENQSEMVTGTRECKQPLKAVEEAGAQSFMLNFRGKGIWVGNTEKCQLTTWPPLYQEAET